MAGVSIYVGVCRSSAFRCAVRASRATGAMLSPRQLRNSPDRPLASNEVDHAAAASYHHRWPHWGYTLTLVVGFPKNVDPAGRRPQSEQALTKTAVALGVDRGDPIRNRWTTERLNLSPVASPTACPPTSEILTFPAASEARWLCQCGLLMFNGLGLTAPVHSFFDAGLCCKEN